MAKVKRYAVEKENPRHDREAAMTNNGGMTKGEREELQRLIRHREKVLKSAAKQRSTELRADFENQLGTIYTFDQDEVWQEAEGAAKQETDKANARIAERCRQLGIPKRFAPSINTYWVGRRENAVAERRAELRKMATTRIEAIEQETIVKIEMASVNAQTEIVTNGLSSEAARNFLDRLPSIETLMPKFAIAEIAGEADPPVAEQLVSPNTLRQRRFRERHRNVTGPLRNAIPAPKDDEEAAE